MRQCFSWKQIPEIESSDSDKDCPAPLHTGMHHAGTLLHPIDVSPFRSGSADDTDASVAERVGGLAMGDVAAACPLLRHQGVRRDPAGWAEATELLREVTAL